MEDLIKYVNRNKLEKGICEQIERLIRVQYESSYTSAFVLQDIPVSIRAKVIRLQEEFFLPGEVILEQGNAVDQLYLEYHGLLEGVGISEDGTKETILQFGLNSSFGDIVILYNLPQPFTVRVCELCSLLQLDRQSFTNILEIYSVDAKIVLSNLLEGAKLDPNDASNQLLKVVSRGDLGFLKRILSRGADPNSKDYDHHTPIHIAACEGLYLMAEVLLEAGASVFTIDRWGTTSLDEARKRGSSSFIKLFENAKSKELLNFPDRSQEV